MDNEVVVLLRVRGFEDCGVRDYWRKRGRVSEMAADVSNTFSRTVKGFVWRAFNQAAPGRANFSLRRLRD
jgi:hypothetical protein